MPQQDYLTLLQFSDRWLQLGVLTEERMEVLGRECEKGEDPNTEHYRYCVFHEYFDSHRPLSPEQSEALYDLAGEDPDPLMGGAIRNDIVGARECPPSVLAKALASGEPHLVRKVLRQELWSAMEGGLTPEVFERCLASADGPIHRERLARSDLSRQQLEQLAEAGANRAVRNMATERLQARPREA